jgi:acyl-coenzyme A thioesterase PaaI-like protein
MASQKEEVENWAKGGLPLYEFMDLRIAGGENGFYRCFVPLNENTGNHISTFHAALQFAAAEILGGVVVVENRASDKYVPVVRSLNIEFKKPAMTDIFTEAYFSEQDAKKMNAAMASDGRYDFELKINIKNTSGEIVSEVTGSYAIRLMG